MISKALAISVALILLLSCVAPPAHGQLHHTPAEKATSRRLQNQKLFTISGQVTRESDRKPLAGAVITLLNREGVEEKQVTTSDSGIYMFSKLVPGEYKLVEKNPDGYPLDIRPEDNMISVSLAGRNSRGNDFIDAEFPESNTANVTDARFPDVGICFEDVGANRRLQQQWYGFQVCNIEAPGEVVNFHIECDPGGTYLDFQIADVGIPGDHWQLKGKLWDNNPNTAVTTAPGPIWAYSVPGRVYSYGPYPFQSFTGQGINALVECSYLHGVNVFGAGSIVYFKSNAPSCTVQSSKVAPRIDRSP